MGVAMIILVGHQKGGCGKSTVATNIATIFANSGKDFILVDCDPQQSSTNWVSSRQLDEDLPQITVAQLYGNKIAKSLVDFNNRYKFVVVDVAGRDSAELRSALTVSDICIAPFFVSQFDLETTSKLDQIVDDAKITNPNLRVFGLLNGVSSHPKDSRAKAAAEFLGEYENIEVLNTRWHRLSAFSDSISDGKGVIEYTDKKAKDEAISLVKEIFDAIS